MKKPTILKIAILLLLILQADVVFSQTYKAFNKEYTTQVRGDIINIGNSILNRGTKKSDGTYSVSPNTPFSGTTSNDTNGNFDMYYINVDPVSNNSTPIFSSSSATLTVPNNIAPAAPCYKVAYAALYWSGILRSPADRTKIKNVKIKVPNTTNSNYQDVVGTVIWDIDKNADGISDSGGNKTQAYACFAPITSLLNATNPNGVYTVANVLATEGVKNTNGSTGLAAGWSLFIIYEDNSLPTKSISTFNGFFGIGSNAGPISTTVNGFTTPDLGDVNARVAFSALEGDQNYSGDYLYINSKSITTSPSSVRPINNFFKSSITTSNGVFTDRNPNGTNTLGFDAGVLDITPQSGIIPNKATSAQITIGTNVDVYINYFLAFSVDVIAPNVKLIKKVHDAAEVDAENKNVTLGQELRYTLSFKNSGNDSATEFTITDQLPTNTNFNFPADIFKLPTGMTIANNVTYNAATRTITFKVPNSLVEKNDPEETIRFKVKVVDDCASLIDACNNVIRNSALTSYRGNPAAGGGGNGTLFGDTSYASANSCNATPQSTNFLVGLDACKNSKAEICLTDMELSAAGGYTTYKWATSTAYNPVLGTNQKLKITGPGTYYVYSTKTGCPDFEQIITVTDGGGVKTNPIIKYADNKDSNGVIAPCDIDGKPLPKIFLCGANDSRLFDLALPSATVVWEKTTCVRPPLSELSDLCADERASCTWVSAGPNGSLFTASEAGYYRVTISSGGCVNKFYFNVYKSDVAINETHKNILCTTPGSITVDKLTGYEFSLTHVLIPASSSTTTAWGDSNVFSITQEGNYVVNYRLKNVNPTCAYKTNQIIIAKDGFTVGIDNPNENPLCFGDKGRIQVSATSGFTGYYYTVYEDGVLYQDLGPLPNRTQDFKDLTPGKTYRIVVFTKKADGSIECTDEVSKLIPNPAAALTLTSSVIKPLTACADGQYRITASGGKFPYAFFVDGSATEYALDENGNTDLNSIILNTPTAKEYTILVRDFNRCETTYKFTVAANPKPVYTVVPSTINCYGEKGSITVNVTNANGYALEYSIDNGATFGSNPTFLNLKEGTYNVVVRYTLSGQTCTDPAQAVAILPPANALTASGGVSELAGCRLGGLGGRLRFTNVTGGTIPYEYSFDGGASWQTSPEKDVMDGTYVLIVRDSKGCTYKLPYDVILDPKPADPQIDPINVVYNCTGTGIATVTVNNPANGNYSYEYYLDDVPNTPIDNNVFTNVISGSHNIKVKYKLEDASTYSNLLKEDFGHGDPTTSPGIAAAYCFNDQRVTAPYVCGTQSVEDNQYSVASFFWRNDNAWYHFKDHTSNGAVADGRYLLVNIGSAAGDYGILYSKPIADVIPNQPVKVDLAVANLLNAGKGGAAPIVRFELVNPAGVVVARVDTGKIAEDPNDPNRTKWIEIPTISLNPGNNTNLTFVIRSGSLEYNGNDLLIDDISVYQLPKSCLQEQKILFDVGTDKAFTVLEPVIQDVACNGGNTGAITITAQNFGARFYYSINGGTLQSSTTSPVTISGLTAGNYSVVVQSDAAGTCSKSYSKTIGSPSAVTVTASVTTPLTCNPNSAAITAVAVGGTSPYKYELRAADGVTVITAFQDSAVFTGLGKGTYTVAAKDLRGCSSAVSTAVIINDAPPVTASLASSSDLCFDANKATIVVTASGTGTLSYSLDGAAAVTTNTFTNVGVGTHSVLVTDANNCTVTVSNIIVAPELKGKPQVTKTLDCNTAGATIKVDIEGGTAPFTYKYKLGASGTYSSSIPVTGTSFNYAAAGAGTYYFEISDANSPTSCKVEVSATVDAITNPTVTAQPVQVTCNGGSTGEVTLVASGGSGGYSYSFNNSGFTTTIKYTGLKAGIAYPFQVMDDKGCKSAIGSITLTEPTAVQGTINATELTCSSTGTVPAVVTVTGSGGTGPYQYSFNGTSNFTTTNTYSTSAAGTVTAYIKDSNNCQIGPLSITIATLYQITDITITDNGYDCSTTPPGGHVNIAAVKGGVSAPIRYQIISGPAGYDTATNSDGEFKSLAPGSYIFQATDIKTGCSFTKQYTVNGSPDIVTGGSILTTIKCFGGTGTIQFTVNGIKSRFDYVIKNGSGTIIQSANNLVGSTNTTITVGTALAAGAYTITATDRTTKCQSAYTVTLTQPANALDVTATVPNINCNNGQAIITAVGSGGTTSYTYAVVIKGAVPTAGAYGTDPKLSVNTVNGTKVDWDVYIKDANGCTDFVSVKVLQDQTPSVTATLDNQCTGSGNKFRITANGTGGIAPLTYGINGATGAFGPDNFFDVVASATPYIVWVKDANGCTAQAAAITVYPQLTATTAIKELDCSTTNPDATITVTPNGGKSPYTYQVSTNNGTSYSAMASNVYTTSTAGTFLIKVTDANGCTFVTTTPILSISNPTVTANQINVSCNGGADGSVQLIGAGGSLTGGQNYQYSKYGIIYGSASSFTGLAAGDYDFFVKDSKGCVGKITVTITEPSKLVVSASATKFTCSTTNTKQAAVVTIAVPTTGTSPYEYSFNGGGYAAGRTLTVNDNGTDQVINYSVKDAKGCTASGSLTLNKLNPPVIASVTPTAVTCLATSSSVTVTTTAGTGVAPLAYTIIAPASATSNVTGATSGVFTGLAPDTYTFKVTDANGCYDTKSVTVNPVTPIAIAGNKNNDAKCKGTSTGNGTFTISGIATVGNYSFTLTAGTLGTGTLTKSGNTLSLTNVAAGTYTVSVTDTATGCTNSTSITIGEPALALDVTALATNINCNNDNAVITATATGGTTNYSYAVVKQGASAPATTAYGTNKVLTVDTNSGADMNWVVYVMDANGCTDTVAVPLATDPTPSVTAVLSNQCTGTGSGFTITATGTGGTGTLQYGINGVNGAFSTSNVFNVAAGTYTVWVKDANNCPASATPITVNPQLTAVAKVTKQLDCTPTPNAAITVDITGGKSTYTYKVDPGTGTYGASIPVTGTQFVYTGAAAAGTYNFEITDSNNPTACKVIVSATVNAISNPTVTATQVNITCFGANNGSVVLTGSGGSGNYTYSDALAGTYSTTASFTGLTPGSHTFYVKDSKLCSGSVTVTILEPTALVVSATSTGFTCSTTNTKVAGSVTIAVPTTGTSPYEYSFNGGGYGSTRVLTVNDNGTDQTINYSVRDAKGCITNGSVVLNKLNSPKINTVVASAVTCLATSSTVTVTTTVGTGVGTLVYSIISPATATGNTTGATSGVFTGLAPDTYTFKVTDANGCYDTKSITVNPVTPIAVGVSKLSDVKCKGDTTGSARYTVTGFSSTGNYSVVVTTSPTGLPYTTSTSGDVITLTGMSNGNYTLAVVDNTTGCPANATITIAEPANALSATFATVNANCLVGTSKVTVTAAGGTIAYKYAFIHDGATLNASDFGPSNVAYLDPATTDWDVYVRDANNCQVKLDVTIAKDNAPTVTASAVGQCLGVGTYTITAVGTGTGTLQYSINGTSYQAGNTFTVTAAGTYNIWVKDANGCTAQTTVPVIVNDKLTLSAQLNKNITCVVGSEAAQITLTAGGGNGVYTYSFTSSAAAPTAVLSGNVLTTSDAGNYTFTVTDGRGCTFTTTVPVSITLPVYPEITGVTQTQFINCFGEETAAISIAVDNTKGVSPFVFNVRRTAPTVKDYGTQTSGLTAGDYTITVTDSKGCTDTETIHINEPLKIVVTSHAVNITCVPGVGTSKGSVIVDNVTGGTAPYTYYVTGINNYFASENNLSGTTSVTFDVVDFGLYQIRVVDAKGCTVVKSDVLVASPPSALDIQVDLSTVYCTAVGPIPAGGTAVVKIGSTYIGPLPFHFNIYRGATPPQIFTADGTDGWQGEDPAGSKQTTFTGLTPGVQYTFIVYDENTKCYYYQVAGDKIPTNTQLTVAATGHNITCTGAADGAVDFVVTNPYGSATPITIGYDVINAFNNLSTGITGTSPSTTSNFAMSNVGPLPKGTYYVLIKELVGPNAGCSVASANFNILESPQLLVLTASVIKKANCANNSGIITATASFGTAPYTYQLLPDTAVAPTSGTSGWNTPNTFNANAGDYVVYAKDAYNCIKAFPITLDKYTDPTINVPAAICYTGSPFTFTITGSVDPTIVGGATYSVDGSTFQSSPTFTFSAAKVYTLSIKDGNGCIASTPFEVKPQLKLDVKQTRDLSCIVGSEDAQFTLTATDGYGTYAYSYTYNGGTSTTMPSNVLTAGGVGTYVFTVTDAQNCQATYTINLDAIPTINFTVSSVDASCNLASDGTITAVVSAGVGPFKYQLEDGATIVAAYQDSNEFKNLPAKTTYVVRVKDARDCTDTKPATIGQPTPLTASSTITTALLCTAGNAPSKAVVTVTPSGGTSPYQYSYDNGTSFSGTNTYETFAGITFDVIVKDANGCTFTITNGVNVPALNPPTDLTFATTVAVICGGKGTVDITGHTGGVGALQYEILSPIVRAKQASTTFANLDPDTYVFQITDANGCTYSESYTVAPVTNITVAGQLVRNVTCNPGANGEVLFTVGNFAGTYSYSLNGAPAVTGQTSATISVTGITAAGPQTIVITDEITTCTATATVTVAQPTALGLVVASNINANCNTGAKVSVTASGGTAPYQYSFVPATATGPGTYADSNAAVLDPATLNWKVYVKDVNGCEITAPLAFSIIKDASPTMTAPAPICFTGAPVAIDLSLVATVPVAGTRVYRVNGSDITGSVYTVTTPGTYQFSVVDVNGCESNIITYEVKPQVTLVASLDQDLTCVVNASISLTPGGGTGTYTTYEVDINGGGYNPITLPYNPSVAGSYTFRVTDSQGCPAVSNVVIVTPKTAPTATAVATDVSCNLGSNGSITVTASNGIAPYKYQLSQGGTILTAYQDGNIFSNLSAATNYTVEVKDAKGCIIAVPVPVTIAQPTPLTASSTITTALLCTAGNAPSKAVVTVTPSGGTSPYQYSYDNGTSFSGTNTYETFAGITFDVIVKDANGCTFTITNGVNVPALNPPTDLTFATTVPVTCLVKGTVDITGHTGGVGPFQYEILSPIVRAKQGSTTFANLDPDTYVFQITDANGCTYNESYTVAPVTNITVASSLIKNVSCNGGTDGSIKFTVENKAGGFTYSLSPALGTATQVGDVITVTNLPANTYTLTVTDAITGCTATAIIDVAQPAVLDVALVSKTAANCYLGSIVTVQATGGTPVYKYAFVKAGVTPTAADFSTSNSTVLAYDDLGSNDWDVYVQDANLICSDKVLVTITKHQAPTINPNANVYCYTGGPVPITITGTTDPAIATPPMYSIGNGYYASPNFTLNAPGTYEFFIKDGNGCVAKATYVLRQELLIQATLTQDLNCTTNDATITLTATQGTGAGTYAFEYDLNNSGVYNPVTALPFVTSTAGTYTFRVKDAVTCEAVSVPVVVTPLTIPTFATSAVNALCQGDLNGSITVTASNGVAPYKYSINGGTFVNSNIFAGLGRGTYAIAVMDAKGCSSAAVNVDITDPVVLTATNVVSPFGCDPSNTAKDASVTLTAHDGTGPYSYSFDNGVSFGASPTHIVNAASTINYVVVDFNGCRVSGSVTVPGYNPPTKFDLSATPIYCNTVGGVATVTVSNIVGGVAPFNYAITQPTGSATSNATGSFAGLLPGTYVIKVTDFNGCSTLNSIEVKKASEISVDAQLLSDVLCNAGTTGSIAFTISNYIAPANYTFALSPNNGTFTQTGDVVTYTGLTAASYTFTVTDNTSGCTDNVSNFIVNQPAAALNFTMAATNITCNNKNATITVTATGGTPAYSYAAVASGTAAPTVYSTDNKIVVDTNNGTVLAWDVYVKDFNGCTTLVKTQNISTAPLPSGITANVASQCPSATGTYDFTVTVTSGVGPFEYSIGGGFQASPTFSVNSSGSYDITVKDANGCTTTVTGAVVISGALDLQLDVQKLPSCDFPDGRIVAKATGGSGNYKYTSGAYIPVIAGTTATFNNMAAGSHTITVEDLTTGCKDVVTVEMKAATLITGLSLEKYDVKCNGDSNGLIIVHLAPNAPGVNDNPVYTYTLTGTTIGNVAVSRGPQEENVFDNLLPGDYTVRVTSGRGCNAQADTRIIQPAPVVVNAPAVTSFVCTTGTNTTNFASITVNSVTGGTGPYVLYEFSKNGTVVQSSSSNVYNETDLAGGSYTVRVFDSNGCIGSSTTPITIAPFITMDDLNVAVVTPITCVANETIQVSVTATGGTPTGLVYTLKGIEGTVFNQTNPTGLFSGLAIGKYEITVFNPATGCTIKDYHYIYDPNTFIIKATPISGEICYGTADGSVDLLFVDTLLIPTNDAGAFTYTITGPVPSSGTSSTAGPVTITGLTAGQYTVTATLTSATGPQCTVSTVFSIKQPIAPLAITKTQSPITCAAGNNDGTISVAASGGYDMTYEYELVGPVSKTYSTENVFTGLTAGAYTINVRDAKGCIATTTATLVNPAPIVVNPTASTTMLSCHGDKSAVITVALPTGGQGSNYMYTLNKISDTPISVEGPQSSPVFAGLGAGTYTVTVTDGFSCSATSAQIVINEPTIVEGTLIQSKIETCTTQAQLTLSAVGGKAPYTYSLNGTTVLGTFTSSVTFNVAPGVYSYIIKDANGCTGFATNGITVAPLIPLTVGLDVSSAIVRCKGDATAILIAQAEGGLGNYVYTLYSGTTGTNIVRAAQNNGTFLDLPVGFYRVGVQSGDCSKVSAAFEIIEPQTPFRVDFAQTNVSCFGESNGKMVITATGGTGAYKYSISPDSDQYDTKNVFENLAVGQYTVTAIDANGCNEVYTFTITQPELLRGKEVPNSMIPEVCVGDKDGAFSVEILGGTAPYKVSLDNEKGPFTAGAAGQTIFDFTNLTGGTHTVYFTDAAGCMNLLAINMPLPVVLNPTAEVNYDCVDNKAANMVTITVDKSITNLADVDYQLDGTGAYQPSNIFRNLAPGNHYVTARHTNGCEVPTASFQIKAVQPLKLALSAGKPEMNIISVTATGGAPGYEYSFNGEPFTSSNTYKIYKSGDYVVVVRDQNGCTSTITVPAIYVDVCLDNYFTPNGDGVYDTWGPGCTNIYNNLEFSIFDRYGRVIAKYHYGQKWDGRYNGEELPSGDYWYVLKLNDEKDAREFVGHFTLYR